MSRLLLGQPEQTKTFIVAALKIISSKVYQGFENKDLLFCTVQLGNVSARHSKIKTNRKTGVTN